MIKLFSLLILAAALFLSCVIGFVDVDTCGGEKYTSRNQICEDDVLNDLCGEDYYNTKMQFCFEQDNKIYDKCDGEIYNPLNQKCTDSILKTKCGEDYYDPKIQFCFEQDNKIYDKCDGKIYNPLNQECTDNILKTKCGKDYYDPKIQFCFEQDNKIYDKCEGRIYDVLKNDCCNNVEITRAIQECKNGTLLNRCKNELYNPFFQSCIDNVVRNKEEFIDSRDGKTYKYVTIGSQIWMAENLRYETPNTKCYDDNPDNCEIYGMLYDWNTSKTACPSGWHLPTNYELSILRKIPYRDLKAHSDTWIYSGRGTDIFGFSSLPGGQCYETECRDIGLIDSFWIVFDVDIGVWLSIRCLKD